MSDDDYIAQNRANWNERVESHLVAYGTDAFVADATFISDVVRDDFDAIAPFLPDGSVTGLTLAHLQCHIGTDTLSWARLGAQVTGIDFSAEAIAAARGLAARAGLAATFVESTVDDAADAVGSEAGTFDLVYTSIGAITWLPYLEKWAASIRALLKPGGLFYIRDAHPMLAAVDYERNDERHEELVLTMPYFATNEPITFDDGTTYADDAVRLYNAVTHEWPHSVSEIIQPLLAEGLQLLSFQEQATIPWRALPSMIETKHGFALSDHRERLPLTFSLVARLV